MVEWLSFGTTIVLAAITGWYAILTRDLAKSARESARSAERAAALAAQSVAASVASVNVRFRATPSYSLDSGEKMTLGVTLLCAGATVFVHSAVLIPANRSTEYSKNMESFESLVYEPAGHGLECATELPARLHKNESLDFESSPAVELDVNTSVATLTVRVTYSLDGESEGIEREVLWHGEHGIDYESRP